MLNEERVKHMVKLAFYETTDGKEELKAGSYYKKDYINYYKCFFCNISIHFLYPNKCYNKLILLNLFQRIHLHNLL